MHYMHMCDMNTLQHARCDLEVGRLSSIEEEVRLDFLRCRSSLPLCNRIYIFMDNIFNYVVKTFFFGRRAGRGGGGGLVYKKKLATLYLCVKVSELH